jgi:hypothetical protein
MTLGALTLRCDVCSGDTIGMKEGRPGIAMGTIIS